MTDVPSAPHGVADWPHGRTTSPLTRPAFLPGGRPWPRLRVVTFAAGDEARLADGIASVARQDYPECRHDVMPPGMASIGAILADETVDCLLVLRAGDLLAPGALAALALDAVLTGAGAVAGLRVLFGEGVTGLDVPAASGLEAAADIPFTGGEILWSRRALGDADPTDPRWAAKAWARVAGTEAGITRIGRPVLLQYQGVQTQAAFFPPPSAGEGGPRSGSGEGNHLSGHGAPLFRPSLTPRGPIGPPSPAEGGGMRFLRDPQRRETPGASPCKRPGPPSSARSLSIASLTGTGHAGGAGIAHRRVGEALRLAGHRVADFTLADESPPASAEWTDAFPRTEAAIDEGGHDLVLAGNLHGATRSLDVIGRLAARLPVALVLHDLFPLTGRCAHPRDGPRIAAAGCDAACPTPDEYPQLARPRIAGVYADKRAVLAGPDGPLLLANSAWTAARAEALAPEGTAVAPVALAFPTSVFRLADRRSLRRELGLPADDLLILVSAVVLDGPDKNIADLATALRRVAHPGIGFVAIGRLDHPARLDLPNLFAPGSIADEARLAAWYGACDLHVTASRLETLGQTPIEAGLCGTPTLAYRTAGLTTSVIDGVTGRLVPVEPGALGDALVDLVGDRARLARLGAFARIALESRFSPAACAISFERVFRARGLLPQGERPRFSAGMLGHFPFAAAPISAATGLVAAASNPLVRGLRRTKQRWLGRRLPLWIRLGLHLAARVQARRGSR